MSTYGRRGGEGPTRGRRKAVYQAQLPDGYVLEAGTFHFEDREAVMTAFAPKNGHGWIKSVYQVGKVPDHILALQRTQDPSAKEVHILEARRVR